jgi:hypothetical protein
MAEKTAGSTRGMGRQARLTAKKRDAAGRRRRSWRSWRIRVWGGRDRRETTLSTSSTSICETPSISLQAPLLDFQLQTRGLFFIGDLFAVTLSSPLDGELLLSDRL